MKIFFYLTFFLAFSRPASGQFHDNNWVFGYSNLNNYDSISNWGGVRMHFEKGYPEYSYENIKCHYSIYGGTCSDSTGNLVFHTNGFAIRNKWHQIMENGDTLNPGYYYYEYLAHNLPSGYPSITGSTPIPIPGYPHQYYLFHTALNDDMASPIYFPKLYYSRIDMNANGGLGKVVEKNVILAEGDFPFAMLVKHGNGRDWWCLAPDFVEETCRTYLIDPSGIHRLDDQDIMEEPIHNTNGYAYMDFTNDGSRFAYNDSHAGLWVYDFDRCTGLLSNPVQVGYNFPDLYGSTLAFSPGGRFLYLGTNKVIYQLDIQKLDTINYIALDTVTVYNGGASPFPPFYLHFLLPQLAPDGKIYYTTFSSTQAYHVINQPDLPTPLCDFAQKGEAFTRYRDGTWCYYPDYRLGKMEGGDCDTLGFTSNEVNFIKTYPKEKEQETYQVRRVQLQQSMLSGATSDPVLSGTERSDPLDPGELTRKLIRNFRAAAGHTPVEPTEHLPIHRN